MANSKTAGDEGQRLPDGPGPRGPRPELEAAAHPSRGLASRFFRSGHDDDVRDHLREFYEGQAGEWTDWVAGHVDYLAPMTHALQNLTSRGRRLAVEVAAGTGQATSLIGEVATRVLATDAVQAMVREGSSAVGNVFWVVADAGRLPIRDASVDLLVACNAVFSAVETDRVLLPGGELLVVSSFGEMTPIRHSRHTLREQFTGWTMTWAVAGHGDWVLLEKPRL